MICKDCNAPVPLDWLADTHTPTCPVCGDSLRVEIRDLLGEDNLMGYAMREPQFDMATHIDTLLTQATAHAKLIKAYCLMRGGKKEDPKWMRFRTEAIGKYGTCERYSGIIEAPTGTGKTLAYLAPAVASSGHRIVIATANKALQKQIVDEDGPAICDAVSKVLPRPKIAIKKGKSNYVCLVAAHRIRKPSGSVKKFVEAMTTKMALQDKDVMDPKPPWVDDVSVVVCQGSSCKYSDNCLFYQTKLDIEEADIVVTNQHSLALEYAIKKRTKGNAVDLLFGERSGVIIDEAHNFADIVAWAFATSTDMRKATVDLNDDDFPEAAAAVNRVGDWLTKHRPQTPLLLSSKSAAPLMTLIGIARNELSSARSTAEAAQAAAWTEWKNIRDGTATGDAAAAFDDVIETKQCARRIGNVLATFDQADDLEYTAAWFDKSGRGSWEFKTSPVNIRPTLREFWEEYATIMTSATISSTDAKTGQPSFKQFRRKLGIVNLPAANELVVGSPFNYKAKTLAYITADERLAKPGWGAEEGDLKLYYDNMAEEICEWLVATGGRTMVLFASRQDMTEFWDRAQINRSVAHLSFLLQSQELSASLLAAKYMELARADLHVRPRIGPVMLGLNSIWEGISIKYDHLVSVIIPRVPFANNNDPVHRRREASMRKFYEENTDMDEKQIRNRLFSELQLYETSIKLRQGTGRLIRTTKDAGIVVLLDYKLKGKYYGNKLIREIPSAVNGTHDKAAALKAWGRINAGLTAMRDRGSKK